MTQSVTDYLSRHQRWTSTLTRLRALALEAGLVETIKWGAPVYTLEGGGNVVGLGAFKSYAGLWFFDGALLEDRDQVLVNAQQGKTRGMRQWRFAAGQAVPDDAVRHYLDEAIANAFSGRRVAPRRNQTFVIPPELSAALQESPQIAAAFDQLTPGRQREYAEYIQSARRADTKSRRIEKILPMIASDSGLNDRYRDC